jgi:cytochrome b6-f complex iron-sulfur subunit
LSNNESHHPTRRSFLGKLALGIGGIAAAGSAFAAVRSLVPNVLYEPSKTVKVGLPELIPDGVTFFKEAKAFVFKKSMEGKTSFSCISAVCTHLGCLVQHVAKEETVSAPHKETQVGFSCPCHGSRFTIDGKVVGGPAPKNLPWLALAVSPDDGQLVVNTAAHVGTGKSLLVLDLTGRDVRKV